VFLRVHSYLSEVAQTDIDRIFGQKVESSGIWLAWMEMERIRQHIDDLSLNPGLGDIRDDIWHGLLSTQHDDYVIYFRRTNSELGVDILAVGSVDEDPGVSKSVNGVAAEAVAKASSNIHTTH